MNTQDKELMYWMASDKDLQECSIILGVSHNAVIQRAKRIRLELEVNTNTGMIAKAASLGLLDVGSLHYARVSKCKKAAVAFMCCLALISIFGDDERPRRLRFRRSEHAILSLDAEA